MAIGQFFLLNFNHVGISHIIENLDQNRHSCIIYKVTEIDMVPKNNFLLFWELPTEMRTSFLFI